MLESSLSIANYYWDGDTFRPRLPAEFAAASRDVRQQELAHTLARFEGQFALGTTSGSHVVLARDKHGVNKLFFAIRNDGAVVASNYVIDLIQKGVPFGAIYSVPSGHFAIIDAEQRTLETVRYHEPRIIPQPGAAGRIRGALEAWFGRMARDLGDREILLCLSGGLDSSLVAALARRHFGRVTAYTYSYVDTEHPESEDAQYARRMAEHLAIPLRLVPASRSDILGALDEALVYGQDWRDFNVHCAIVNVLLARAMADHGRNALVLTGDQMNEIVADYTPISYRGCEYYPLPKLDFDRLRATLIAGLDSGDREIGVFHHHGLDVIQPYGLVAKEYSCVASAELAHENGKQALAEAVGGDLLPAFIKERRKVRAQIGTSGQPTGILPTLVDSGHDSASLKAAWQQRFGVADGRRQTAFLRGGFYRSTHAFPKGIDDGYFAD